MTLLQFLVFLIFVGFFILLFSVMGTGSGLPWASRGPKVRNSPEKERIRRAKLERRNRNGAGDVSDAGDGGGDGGGGGD